MYGLRREGWISTLVTFYHIMWMLSAAIGAATTPSSLMSIQYRCPDLQVADNPICNRTCREAIGSALLDIYQVLKGDDGPGDLWHQMDDLCQNCSWGPSYCCWPGVFCCSEQDHTFDMPDSSDECAGVTRMSVYHLAMRGFNLSGSIDATVIEHLAFLDAHGLQTLDLSSNHIVGSVPASIGQLTNLTTINLNLNNISGELPLVLNKLTNLQHFYASFNRLTGSLDGRFCTEPDSPLYSLILRANNFAGTANFSSCSNLGLLDISDNRFIGTLPVSVSNGKLVSFRASNNLFNESIPDDIWKLPQLATLELANNDLIGTLSSYMGSGNNLVNIRLGNNSLNGTIPGNLTSNSQMLLLELYDNPGVYGTFPDVQSMVGIRTLDFHNTSISGTIPEIWASFPYLEYVDITSTRMTCCTSQSYVDAAAVDNLLPNFLFFDGNLTQYDAARGIEDKNLLDSVQPTDLLCGSVQRNTSLQSEEWNYFDLPVTSNILSKQKWLISPVYSWYKNCTCRPGSDQDSSPSALVPVVRTSLWCKNWSAPWNGPCLDMHTFQCRPHEDAHLSLQGKVGLAVGGAVMLVVLVCAANMCMVYASKVRRLFIRAKMRQRGVPRHGRMSLVVTDIEGYSDIFKRAPEVMYQALLLHNSVIRAAKFANCGFILEQEGDSFTLAFYSAFDAVAFCLQAQQALLAVPWPEGLGLDDQQQSIGPMSRRQPSRLQKRLSQLLASGARRRSKPGVQSGVSTTSSEGQPVVNTQHTGSQGLVSRLPGLSGLRSPPPGEAALFSGLRVRMGVVTGGVPAGTPVKSSALFQLAKVVSDFGNGGQTMLDEHTFEVIREQLPVLGAVECSGVDYRRLASGRSLWSRVGSMCGCSSLPQPAEEAVVLDMGAYRQQSKPGAADLLYCSSFAAGATDTTPKGRSEPDCRSRLSFLWGRLRSGSTLSSSNSWLSNKDGDGDIIAGPASRQQIAEAPPVAPNGSSGRSSNSFSVAIAHWQRSRSAQPRDGRGEIRSGSCSEGPPVTAGISNTFASITARANQSPVAKLQRHLSRGDSLKRRDYGNVRLFQILPPSLAARAHVWHNKLNLKDGWICWDMPYFDAPGSLLVPISATTSDTSRHSVTSGDPSSRPISRHGAQAASAGSSPSYIPGVPRISSASSDEPPGALSTTMLGLDGLQMQPFHPPVPPVTMVFASVEHPEQVLKRRKSLAPILVQLLNKVVRDALRRCGGYLCRVQEGELRFMLAFSNPTIALEWCLIVQEAVMFLPWPNELSSHPGCTVERDTSGQVVFGGPRFKMGVCEGPPQSILPDHMGRADYLSPSTNMAARITDKAAKGGQIACTAELAQAVLAQWTAAGAALGQSMLESTQGTAAGSVANGSRHSDPGWSSATANQPTMCPSFRAASMSAGLGAWPASDVAKQQAVLQRSISTTATPLLKIDSGRMLLDLDLDLDLEEGLQASEQHLLGHSSSTLLQNQAAAACTGTSAFVLQGVQKAPVQVEVHRLGLFRFKGGPPQQEIVQVIFSQLSGRTAFTENAVITPSRKGQMLQKLQGRIGEPVTLHLPTLAQEYRDQILTEVLPKSRDHSSSTWGSAAGMRTATAAAGPLATDDIDATAPATS